jgi:hypothetical protein
MSIDWLWLFIGFLLGTFVGGRIIATATGLFNKAA